MKQTNAPIKSPGGPGGGGPGGRGGNSGASGAGGAGGGAGAGGQDPNALLDKAKLKDNNKKKLLRGLTVVAYLFFVSLAAIVLAIYYAIFWDHVPTEPKQVVDASEFEEM
ncbi:uncharacterized protein LOC142338210 [Convolutriloba macropyga]|uniref:uncharacterized protein LOC142338210 n=1 Tax=Convolutriloba macropyga TaxID=536237 RepID=UPI003F525048